jgi:uncharacterized membrane protein
VTRRQALVVWALGSVGFVVACVLVRHGLRDDSLYSDLHVYDRYAGAMTGGRVPYRDFYDEYPPLAQPVFVVGRAAGAAHFALAFKSFMALCGVGALGCAVFTLRAVGAGLGRAVLAAAVIGAAPLLVGPIFLNAYDLWPAFLLSLALLLLVLKRPVAALAVLGAAVAAKVYPVAVLPLALLHVDRRLRMRAFAAFAVVLVAAHLPFAVLGPGGLKESYRVQAVRGLELNSLGASLLLAAGHPSTANQPPGSLNVTGGAAHALAVLSTVLVLAAIASATLAYLRGRPLVVAAAAAVAGFVAFDKVFSAQYVDWLVPLVPLAGLGAGAVTVVVLVLTQLVFSRRGEIAHDRDVALLLVRNLAVVALFALLLVRGKSSR